MKGNSNITIERYLNSVYLSLARPVELTFNDGTVADGFFGGLDYASGTIIVRNFCVYGSLQLEAEKRLNMTELKFFVVKRVERPISPRPKKAVEAHTKVDAKQEEQPRRTKDNSLIYVKNSEASSFSKKNNNGVISNSNNISSSGGNAKNSKRQSLKEQQAPQPKNTHKNQYGFLTDKEISHKNVVDKRGSTFSQQKQEQVQKDNKATRDKVFEKWRPDNEVQSFEINELGNQVADDRFDQFELNHLINKEKAEEFAEDDYTTRLQLDDFTEEDIAIANKLAREILNSENTHDLNTNHIMEERGLKALVDNEDEEALYSAVIDTNCTFKFKTAKPVPKRKCFHELIIKNWSKGKRKASELIETLSKPMDNKSGNTSFNGIKQNGTSGYKGMYSVGQTSYNSMYMSVS